MLAKPLETFRGFPAFEPYLTCKRFTRYQARDWTLAVTAVWRQQLGA